MTTNTEFQIGKHHILAFGSQNFALWFGGMSFNVPVKFGAFMQKSLRSMFDKEIIEELKITWTTLGQVIYALDNNEISLSKDTPIYNVFYIKDKTGIVRSVSLLYTDGGWIIDSFSIDRPLKWIGGFRFFSKIIALTLATRVELLEERVGRLEAHLVV